MLSQAPAKSNMTQTVDPSDFPIPGSNYQDSDWLAWLDNPSEQDVKWLEADRQKQKLAGEQLRERLSGVPFYAERAARTKAIDGDEALYWESLLSGTHKF